MLYDYSLSQSGEIAAQITTLDRPNEIYTVPGGKLTRISHANDEVLSQLRLSPANTSNSRARTAQPFLAICYKPLDYAQEENIR